MLRTFLSVVAAALLISVILLTPASSADTGEAFIPSGGHRSWTVEMDRTFTLSYSVEALDGSLINILVIPADNYSGYLAGTAFGSIQGIGAENVTNTTGEVQLGPGSYYLVIEDAGSVNDHDGVTISYQIDSIAPPTEGSSMQLILAAGTFVLLGTITFFLIDTRVRRNR